MSDKSIGSAPNRRCTKELVAIMLVLCIMSAAIAGSLVYFLTPRSNQSVYLESNYTIWRNGSTYYVEDAYGHIPNWGEGSNASMIINDALSGLTSGRTWKEKVLIVGNIEITNPLIVNSYTILQLDGQITLANNANTDLVRSYDSVISNSLTYCNNGNGISIEGTTVYTGGGLQLVNFHSYGNHGDGIWSNEYFLGSSIQSESNDGRGVYILHNDVHLSALQIYNNRGGCAIEIGNDTYGPSGVMIEAKTLGNNCSLRLTNGAGNSYTITCWENFTISGTLNPGDDYCICNTKTGYRLDTGGNSTGTSS